MGQFTLPEGMSFGSPEEVEPTEFMLPEGMSFDLPEGMSFDEPEPEPAPAPQGKSTAENLGTVAERGFTTIAQQGGGLIEMAANVEGNAPEWSLMGDDKHMPIWSLQGMGNYLMDTADWAGGSAVKAGVDVADLVTDGEARATMRDTGKMLRSEGQAEMSAPENQYDATGVEKYLYDVAEGTFGMIIPLATGAVTRSPAAAMATIASQVAGGSYADVMEKTGGDHEKASAAARFSIVAETLPEAIPVLAALRKTGAGEGLSRVFETTVGEGAQEMLTEILNSMYTSQQLEGMSFREALANIDWAAVKHAGLVGLGVGGVIGTPGAIADSMSAEKQAVNSNPDKNPPASEIADQIIQGTMGQPGSPVDVAMQTDMIQPEDGADDLSGLVPEDTDADMAAAEARDIAEDARVAAAKPEPAPAQEVLADTTVVPESQETIMRQVEVLADPNSGRDAVYLVPGQQVPAEVNRGDYTVSNLGDGSKAIVQKNAKGKRVSKRLRDAIASGDEQVKQAEIALFTGIGGEGKTPGAPAITVRDPDGTEVQSAIIDPTGEVQANAEQLAVERGGTATVESPEVPIAERIEAAQLEATDLEAGLEPVSDLEAGLDKVFQNEPESGTVKTAMDAVEFAVKEFDLARSEMTGRGRKPTGNDAQRASADSAWMGIAEVLPQLAAEGFDIAPLKAILKKAAGNKAATLTTATSRSGSPIGGRINAGEGGTHRAPKGGWGNVLSEFYDGVKSELDRYASEGPTIAPTAPLAAKAIKTSQPKSAEAATPKKAKVVVSKPTVVADEPVTQEELDIVGEAVLQENEAGEMVEEAALDHEAVADAKYEKSILNSPEEEAKILEQRAAIEGAKASQQEALKTKMDEIREAAKAEADRVGAEQAEEITAAAAKAAKAKPVVVTKKTKAIATSQKRSGKKVTLTPKKTKAPFSFDAQNKKNQEAAAKKPPVKKRRPIAPMGKESLGITEAPVDNAAEIAALLAEDMDAPDINAQKMAEMDNQYTEDDLINDIAEGRILGDRTTQKVEASQAQGKSLKGNPHKGAVINARADATGAMEDTFDTSGEVSANTLVDNIYAQLHESDPYRQLIERMVEVGFEGVSVIRVNEEQMAGIAGANTNGAYVIENDGTRSILMHEDALTNEFGVKVFIHEMVHAMTSEAMRTNNPTALKLEALRKRVIKELEAEGGLYAAQDYGFTNVDEFVAEAMTNPEFQRVLASVKTSRGTTLWTQFLDVISSFLGIKMDQRSALAEALTLSNDLFMTPQEVFESQMDDADYISSGSEIIDAWAGMDQQAMIDQLYGDRSARVLQHKSVDKLLQHKSVTNFQKKAYNFLTGKGGLNRTEQMGFGGVRQKEGLALSTMDQIVRNHAKKFQKGAKNLLKDLQKIQREKTRIARHHQRVAGEVDKLWQALEKETAGYTKTDQLATLMRDTTLSDVNADVGFAHPDNKHLRYKKSPSVLQKNKEMHDAARVRFNAMSPRARSLYRRVKKFYKNQRIEMRNAIIEKISKIHNLHDINVMPAADFATLKNATTAQDIETVDFSTIPNGEDVKNTLTKILTVTSVQGPYFPLRRFGNQAVEATKKYTSRAFPSRAAAIAASKQLKRIHPLDKIASKKIDGAYHVVRNERMFETYETLKEAKLRAVELNKQGYSGLGGVGSVEATVKNEATHVEGGGGPQLMAQANLKLEDGSPESKALETAFTEMLLASSIQKAELKRKKVKGASLDMRRAFAERAFAGSWALADVQTAFDQAESMTALREFAKKEAKDKQGAGNVVHEINQRNETELSERKTHFADAFLSKAGFVYYLMSLSYTAVNLTQPILVAEPYLIGKYGAKGATALFKEYAGTVTKLAAKEAAKVKAGWTGGPENMLDLVLEDSKGTPEGDMLQAMTDQGIIDATFMQELYEASQGKNTRGTAHYLENKLMNVARTLPQIAEVVNRVVVARAAFKLEMATSGDTVLATEAAGEAILQTQFDYSTQNKPRYFKGRPGMKSLMMFKMYAQGMYSLMASNMVKAVSGDTRAEKIRGISTLVGIITTHSIIGGVGGGVVIEPIRALIWTLNQLLQAVGLEDDEDEWDVDAIITTTANDLFDPFVADAVARGLPAAFGVGGGSRVSLSNMMLMGLNDTKTSEEGAVELLIKALGPVAALYLSGARAHDYFKNGEPIKAFESAMPKGVRDLVRGAYRYPVEGPTDRGNRKLPVELNFMQNLGQAIGFTPAPLEKYYENKSIVDRRVRALQEQKKRLIYRWTRSDNQVAFYDEHIAPFNKNHNYDESFEITFEDLDAKEESAWDKEDELRFGKETMSDTEYDLSERLRRFD